MIKIDQNRNIYTDTVNWWNGYDALESTKNSTFQIQVARETPLHNPHSAVYELSEINFIITNLVY